MEKKIEVSFETGYADCSVKIQQVWQHKNTLYVLSKYTRPSGIWCIESEERIHDSVIVEPDQDFPVEHYLIIDPPMATPFVVKGYEPKVIAQETNVPEEIRTEGKTLVKVLPPDPEQVINELVNRINTQWSVLIDLYSLGQDQRLSKMDIQDEAVITALLNKNEHSRKEKYTFLLFYEILGMIEPSVNDEVLQRLNLPKVDITRLEHLAKRYLREINEHATRGISNIDKPANQPEIKPPVKPKVSDFSIFEPLAVAAAALTVTAAILKLTS